MRILLFILLSSLSISTFANNTNANGIVTGKIEYIRVHDGEVHPPWKPPIFWFTLKNVATAGACKQWSKSGTVLFVMDTDQAYSMILSAYMADKEIAVRYDESLKALDANWCKASFITIGNPPPSN